MALRSRILIGLVAAMSCNRASKDEAPLAPPAPPAPPAVGSSATQPADPNEAALAEKMRHCPVTLPGVDTAVADVDGGVTFTMHATDPAVLADARARARELVAVSENRAKGKHNTGKGGGHQRNCPIVTKDTSIVAADIDGGLVVTVKPLDPADLDDLRATTRERMANAPLSRASVVREEASASGETRLYSGSVGDLDGDGKLELVVGGFSADDGGHRSTIRVYRQDGDTWTPVTEGGWADGEGSTVRNVEIADVDGDGKLDIVALGKFGKTSHEAKARLSVFDLVDGKLQKRAEAEWQTGRYTHGYGLAIGDLDGDGTVDIASSGFQFDGTTETGYVRVWSLAKGALHMRSELVLDGQGSPSMRVNDLAIGDVDGDGKPDLVVAGRHGPLKTDASKEHLELRREVGDLSVLDFAGGKLTVKTRFSWAKGTSLRVRSVVVADLDGDNRQELVAGGQYDADGKPCLAVLHMTGGALAIVDDESGGDGVNGEIKDLVVAGDRVIATGVTGEKPGRQGDVVAYRYKGGKLVREAGEVSRNGDETRARALVVVPGKDGPSVLTVGHAKNRNGMVGQVLAWKLE